MAEQDRDIPSLFLENTGGYKHGHFNAVLDF
jgi:hypothetical protein